MRKAEITVDVVSCLIRGSSRSGLGSRSVRSSWTGGTTPRSDSATRCRCGCLPTTRTTIDLLADEIDRAGAIDVWAAALAEEWSGPDLWVHGDVTGSNLLLDDGRLCGVIDFGCSAIGDPACDLAVAWTLFEGMSRERFKSKLALDTATWARARGWALWKALIQIPERPVDDPGRTGRRFGWRWDALGVIEQVIADLHG